MIEATCAACGTMNRIAEADVPVGAKFVSCTSCKAKVALPAKSAVPSPAKPAVPSPAKPPMVPVPPKPPAATAKPVGIPALPTKLPTPPKGVPTPPPAKRDDSLDLADLPAPKRQSALAGAEASGPKSPPRSPLSGAELPAPKATAKPPVPQAGSLDLDDLMPPGDASPGLADLPAPKPKSALADLPAPKMSSKTGLADLPAPKAKTPPVGIPKTKTPTGMPRPAALTDASRNGGVADLPSLRKPAPALTDLPASTAADAGTLDLDDVDLPAPKQGITDLPAPKPGANNDLLAPKGFFEDLPQPARKGGAVDLPAPKGFFDDLPQPASGAGKSQELAPKGFFDDLPGPATAKSQDLAPKGFFDDLPGPATAKSQDLAPKGFFDDLPGAAPGNPLDLAPPGTQDGKGLFDDLPQPSPGGVFDDLQAPDGKNPANVALGAGDIDLGPPIAGPGLELDTSDGPELDLGLPLGKDQAFQDLDLSPPSGKPVEDPSPIKIKTPAKGAEKKPIQINVPPPKGAEVKLDLAEDPHGGKGAPAAVASQKITPKKKSPQESAEARAAKRTRSRIMLASVLGIAALGAGGFFFYQKHAAKKAKEEEIAAQLDKAATALKAADANHWDRARSAAEAALELDGTNSHAQGIAAEAAIAGALDNGRNSEARINRGRGLIQEALGAGNPSPEIERAQALAAIEAKGQAQRAVDLLKAQIGKNSRDGWLQLYLGWAQNKKGDAPEAIKAFDQAMKLTPATKVSALYGQGRAKLMLADVEGARTAFLAILETDKDHVCAQVGLIAARPPTDSTQQVLELEAVLQRRDIEAADPRCRVQAITLIGDTHRSAGRLDAARQRYRDALKLVPMDQPTHNGIAAVELRENKLTLAADHLQKASAVNAEHPDTLTLQAELNIREGKLPDAAKIVEKLSASQPPLPPLAQARLLVVKGRLFEAQGQDEAAVEAFVEGAKLAGELDLTPTMAAVTKLAALAAKEADPAKAAALRARADQLLSALAERAKEDAHLSAAIGTAYLLADDAAKAETYLARAVALKENDIEATLQLAKALNAQGKTDQALTHLRAAQQLDPKRTDIELELARTYQVAGRHDDAVAAFEKLLKAEDVAVIVRVNAGRYFAQRGLIEKAAGQAGPILDAEPQNPGGLYLKAEGLIKAGKPEEATPLLIKASDLDPDAQFLDALGRSLEAQLHKSKDTKYIEGARFAYERASKADPKMFHAWLGQGRMLTHEARRDWEPAIKVLEQASKLDNTHAQVRYYMGVAYFGLRNAKVEYRKVGAGWLESALKARPELDLSLRAEASYRLGQLYVDLNRLPDQVRAMENATRLAEEVEKQTGATPDWLTDTLYELGDAYYKQGNPPQQKRVWERYIARNPKPGVQRTAVEQALRTSLQRY